MEKKKEFLINLLYILSIAALGFLIVKYLVPVLFPFIIAFLIGIVLRKPILKLTTCIPIKEKWMAILYNEKIQPWMEQYMHTVGGNSNGVLATVIPIIQSSLEDLSSNIGTFLSEYSGKITNYISGFAASIPALVVRMVIMVVATFFITVDYRNIQHGIKRILPEKIYCGTFRRIMYLESTIPRSDCIINCNFRYTSSSWYRRSADSMGSDCFSYTAIFFGNWNSYTVSVYNSCSQYIRA